jgi:hypothetical protein
MRTRERARGRTHDAVGDEVERYRRAAEETLDQIEWCIGYLYRIRKPEIARAVERNRSSIRRRMGPADG